MSVRVLSNLPGWSTATKERLDRAVLEMATDIDRRAKILAPVDTGNLVNSGKVTRNGSANYTVSFGGTSGAFNVPYALRREYENKLHPGTLRYLERAGNSVTRGSIRKYIK